ncbi:MAG: Hsp20/alpha crystallin family protein [Sphingobacteriia bacterium]|nr:Hsp20/alpha crystallin family protein [Sphingobacteriia bacterium]
MPVYSHLFENLFDQNTLSNPSNEVDFIPAVNISEDQSGFTIELAVPGMKKDQVKISLENRKLTVMNDQKSEVSEDRKFTRQEFITGRFKRVFTLPETIDVEAVQADMKDGILTVVLPKKENVRVVKQIDIA